MVEQFKHGKFYCGRGVYGNGTYANYDKTVAKAITDEWEGEIKKE